MTGPHLGTRFYFVSEKSSTWYSIRLQTNAEGEYSTWNENTSYAILSFEKIRRDSPPSEAIIGIVKATDEGGCITIEFLSRAKVEVPEQTSLKELKDLSGPYLAGEKPIPTEGEEDPFGRIYPVRGVRLESKQKWCVM
jgi:hypothetical protein